MQSAAAGRFAHRIMKFKHRSAGGWRDPQQHDDVMKITKIVKDLVVEDRTLHKYVHRPVLFIPNRVALCGA